MILLGAVYFILLVILGLLFILGFLIVLTGIILAILFKIKRKKPNGSKRIYRILPVVFICVGIVILIIPFGFTLSIRASNSNTYDGYVNTDILAYYDNNNIYDDNYQNSFLLNNTNYIVLKQLHNNPIYNIKKSNSVANVTTKEYSFSKFLSFVLNKNEIETLYNIQNNSSYDILYETYSGKMFCKKIESEQIIIYYNDMNNYNFKVCNGPNAYNSKFDDIVLNTEFMNKLKKIQLTSYEIEPNNRINISSDFNEKSIYSVSKDNLCFQNFELVKYNNKIYYVMKDNFDVNNKVSNVQVIPLDDEVSNYFLTMF